MVHCYPVNDEKPHVLEGTDCPCKPTTLWQDPFTGETYPEALIVHNAFDCREIVEQAEAILKNS